LEIDPGVYLYFQGPCSKVPGTSSSVQFEVPWQFGTMSLKQAAGHSNILGNNDLDINQLFLMPSNSESRHVLESTRPRMYNGFYCDGYVGVFYVLRMSHSECNIKCSGIDVDVNSQAWSDRY
jgi:hypothetical protein